MRRKIIRRVKEKDPERERVRAIIREDYISPEELNSLPKIGFRKKVTK